MNAKQPFPVYPFDPERLVGNVLHINGSRVQIAMTDQIQLQTSQEFCSVGDYLVVQCGDNALMAQISETGISTQAFTIILNDEQINTNIFAYAELMATIDIKNSAIFPGIVMHPHLGDSVYTAHPKLVQLVIESRFSLDNSKEMLLMSMANLHDAKRTPIMITPEKLFGRHCAVVGSTGSGKSWTLARLIEQASECHAKVILFDASGEFASLDKSTQHLYIGNDPSPLANSRPVAIPYYHLMESDIFAIFNPGGPSQAPKLRAAVKSLKLVRLCQHLAPDGTIIKADRSKVAYEQAYRENIAEIEGPYANFDIRRLTRQIENECVNPQRSATEPLVWGGVNSSDYSYCVPLINRIQDIIASPNLVPIFNSGDCRSLFSEINLFLNDPNISVMRISLKYLAFDHHAREIVTNAIGRYLLDIARKDFFKTKPVLLVVDEAHQFLNRTINEGEGAYKLDSFNLIAKEGRKYSLTSCLATQRPRDIPEDILSQMGTLIVHRLINDLDRSMIERASGDLDRKTAATIPALAPGEALLLGVDFPMPLSVSIIAPTAKPDSTGPNYQKYWK